jgi:hypothetical protein
MGLIWRVRVRDLDVGGRKEPLAWPAHGRPLSPLRCLGLSLQDGNHRHAALVAEGVEWCDVESLGRGLSTAGRFTSSTDTTKRHRPASRPGCIARSKPRR